MTDKERIIIDGVDVSECEQITYKNSLNPMCGNTWFCCYGRENCYFKQLARKTAECEELKESVDKIKNYVKNQMFDVDCKNWFDRFIYTFEDWKKSICEANDRYRKALEEIEEVIQRNDWAVYPHLYKELLGIISKAKGEE